MKLHEVLSFQNFYTSVRDTKLPIKTAYKLTCLAHRVEQEAAFYQSEFSKILDEYALKENGQYVYSEDMTSIKIIEGREEECTAKIMELKNLEIDLSEFTFTLEDFETLNLTISQMDSLMPLIQN